MLLKPFNDVFVPGVSQRDFRPESRWCPAPSPPYSAPPAGESTRCAVVTTYGPAPPRYGAGESGVLAPVATGVKTVCTGGSSAGPAPGTTVPVPPRPAAPPPPSVPARTLSIGTEITLGPRDVTVGKPLYFTVSGFSGQWLKVDVAPVSGTADGFAVAYAISTDSKPSPLSASLFPTVSVQNPDNPVRTTVSVADATDYAATGGAPATAASKAPSGARVAYITVYPFRVSSGVTIKVSAVGACAQCKGPLVPARTFPPPAPPAFVFPQALSFSSTVTLNSPPVGEVTYYFIRSAQRTFRGFFRATLIRDTVAWDDAWAVAAYIAIDTPTFPLDPARVNWQLTPHISVGRLEHYPGSGGVGEDFSLQRVVPLIDHANLISLIGGDAPLTVIANTSDTVIDGQFWGVCVAVMRTGAAANHLKLKIEAVWK